MPNAPTLQWRSQEKNFGRGFKIMAGLVTPEHFRKFSKIFLKKIAKKSIILAYFSKNLTNPALILPAFGRQLQIVWKFWEYFWNFWWKFNRKMEFLSLLWKFVAKNRAFGNNIIFLQQFFPVRGVLNSSYPPAYATATLYY